ncbi:MAG: HD domain-containing protein [Candidatus Paceibacterota bacterium]
MNEDGIRIPEEVTQVTKKLYAAGYEAYVVGGCVRDILRGETPKDWDITTNATPEEILDVFEHAHYDNDFGTVRVVNDITEDQALKTIEVTTYRTESGYTNNRHPDKVEFSQSLSVDLARRDFTINALALDLQNVSRDNTILVSPETLVDEFGGLVDLQKRRLRAVGNPQDRFEEDALRIMRAVRFAAQLGMEIDAETQEAMVQAADRLGDVAIERIRDEFEKLIISDNPKIGLEIARKLGILEIFLPELLNTVDLEQNQAHSYDLWEHLTRACQTTADKGWPLHIRLAALFHDIAKVQTREWSEERNDWSFHNHEVVGARITRNLLNRLKFPKDLVSQVTNLVRWHMFFSDTDEISHSAVRRLIQNVGKENIWDLMKVRRADRLGMGRPKEEPYRLRKYQSMIEEVIRDPVSVSNLAITGNDVIHETNETPGPRIGWILHALLEEVLEDPDFNTKETLLKETKKLSKLPDQDLKERGRSGEREKRAKEEAAIEDIHSKYYVE